MEFKMWNDKNGQAATIEAVRRLRIAPVVSQKDTGLFYIDGIPVGFKVGIVLNKVSEAPDAD